MQTELDFVVHNHNPSKLRGFAFYKENPPSIDVYKLHGVPRSGRTTSLTSGSIDRGEPFLAVVPVHTIANSVISMTKDYVDRVDVGEIVNVPGNQKCLLNEELCEKCPELKMLRFMPIGGDCSECEWFGDCPVTEILRTERIEGITTTYQKIAALVLASHGSNSETDDKKKRKDSTAKQILDKIKKTAKNYIFDEAHELEFGKATRMKVWNTETRQILTETCVYNSISDQFPHIGEVVEGFRQIINSSEMIKALNTLSDDAKNQAWNKKKMSIGVHNPTDLPGKVNDGFAIEVFEELIELVQNRKAYGFDLASILVLQDIFDVVTNPVIHCQASKTQKTTDNAFQAVELVAINATYMMAIRKFMRDVRRPHHRIILTSATFGSYDYKQLFYKNTKIKDVLFGNPGEHGDPNGSCRKMMVIADSFNLSAIGEYSVWHKLEYIISMIYTTIKTFGVQNVIVVAMSKKDARLIEKYSGIRCEYYRSDRMIGVSRNERVMVLVGAAEKPVNAFDAFTSNPEESWIMRREAVAIDTFQAMNRAKDPAGKEPSLIIALGINEVKCIEICTWGPGRTVVHKSCRTDNRYVKVSGKQLASPVVVSNSKTVGIPTIALLHMKIRDSEKIADDVSSKNVPTTGDNIEQNRELLNSDIPLSLLLRGFSTATVPINFDYDENVEEDVTDTGLWSHLYDEYLKELKTTNQEKFQALIAAKTKASEMVDEPQYLADQLAMIRCDKEGKVFTDPVELLAECFFIRDDAVAIQSGSGYQPIRKDMRDTKSDLIPLSANMLEAHLEGKDVTLGTYTLSKDNKAQFLCFDIDAHPKDDDTEYDILARQKTAEKKFALVCNLLDKYGIPYYPEKSGTDFSFHIWIFHKPIDAKVPHWLGKMIWKVLGYPKTEAFPKQSTLKAKDGFGNLLKLPLGKHQKNGRKSNLMIDGRWIRYEDDMWVDEDGNALENQTVRIKAVDLSSVVVPPVVKNHNAKKGEASYSHDYSGYDRGVGLDPFFSWAIQQQLEGSQGDWMRRMLAAYYINQGITDVADLVDLFRGQIDFNEGTTRKKLQYSLERGYATPCWETIMENAPDIVEAFKTNVPYVFKRTE